MARKPLFPLGRSTEPVRPQRGRPPTIDWEKLLEVAREVFLERGIRATTLDVAERAGVSEGAVFHRFKSKDVLFREAMRFDVNKVPERLATALEGVEELEIREGLLQIASTMLEIGRETMPLMMMTWSNPNDGGCMPSNELRLAFRDLLLKFAAYFERRMDAGQLRRMDGEVVARVFMGAIHHFRMSQLAGGENTLPEGMFIRGMVDLLVHGAIAQRESAPRDPLVRT